VFEHILVPLGGSRFAEHALPHAMALASRLGAVLELAMVAEPGDDSREEGRVRAEEYLAEVEERLRNAGFTGLVERTVIPAGNIASSIAGHVASGPADLVAMTTHGRGPVQRAWLGSVADGVIRQSPSPVLLIRPEPGDESGTEPMNLTVPVEDIQRALVPLDGSQAAERALQGVRPLLGAGARVILFQSVGVITPGAYPYLPHSVREEQHQVEIREAARTYLEEAGATLREEGLSVEVIVKTSNQPALAILETVQQEGVQLIAMSTEGRGGVSRLLLGSVADKVVRGSSVPVLVHRDPPAAS